MDEDVRYLNEVLEKTRTKLLDLTRRTRLLNFREAARDIAIVDEMPNQVFEHLVFEKDHFYFDPIAEDDEQLDIDTAVERTLPVSSDTDTSPDRHYSDNRLNTPFKRNELERKLKRLYREHRTIIEETGANSLYLAIGFLQWKDSVPEAKASKSPLMLVPVRLERLGTAGAALYRLVFDDEALNSNYSIVEKLKAGFEITLPHLEDEQLPEDYWSKISDAIQTKHSEGWSIVREMVLGLFSFNKQIMWHDLDPARWPEHSTLFDKAVLRRVLLGAKPDEQPPGQISTEYSQDDSGEEMTRVGSLILDADSSQYSALAECFRQESGLVIEGPPGTGKSQTIANLIASVLAKGETVLFLAEKMAALEVVFKRLEAAGLGEFCLQLHGLKASKVELLESVQKRMDLRTPPPRDIARRQSQHQKTREELLAYSKQLNEQVGPEKFELHRLPWKIELLRQKLPSTFSPQPIERANDMPLEVFDSVRNRLQDLGREWDALPADARACWTGYFPERMDDAAVDAVTESIEQAVNELDRVHESLSRSGAPDCLYEFRRVLVLANSDVVILLPELDDQEQQRLIYEMLHRSMLKDAQNIIRMFSRYRELTTSVNSAFDYSSDLSEEYASLLTTHAGELRTVVLDSTELGDLAKEKEVFSSVVDGLDEMESSVGPILYLTSGFARRLEDFDKLTSRAEEFTKGPLELSLYGDPIYVKKAAETFSQVAKQEYEKLVEKAEELSEFRLGEIENTKALLADSMVVQQSVGHAFRFFRSEYRAARRSVRHLMQRPSEFECKPAFVEKLAALCGFCEARDAFGEDEDYLTALGKMFKGMDTEWGALEAVIAFARALTKDVGQEKAREILVDWDSHCDRMENCANNLRRNLSLIDQFKSSHQFPDSMWERPVAEIRTVLKSWLSKLTNSVELICQPWCSSAISIGGSLKAADDFGLARSIELNIQGTQGFSTLIGVGWDGPATDLRALVGSTRWLESALERKGINEDVLRWLVPSESLVDRSRLEAFLNVANSLRQALGRQVQTMENYGEVDRGAWLGAPNATILSFRERMEQCLVTKVYLPLLARWRIAYNRVKEVGFESFAELVSKGELPGSECANAFECSVYEQVFRAKVQSSELLETFGHTRYENLQARFAEHDRDLLKLNAAKTASDLSSSPVPEGTGYGRVQNYSDKRLLEHEAQKKRRHLPIRQLTTRAGNALQALKPCFLMSPLSVAQYLPPGEIEFDYVVMDEASQIRPEDALGALARGRKAIIVGDPKQLPPTSFFDTASADEDDDEETVVDDTESILDVALKQFPYRRLRWHYRSQHESLIQFSNEQFYDHDLIVFPSPRGDSRDFGVHFNYVEAPAYARGRNRPEAEAVVQRIAHHYKSHPEVSLGVAAFNKRQAEEIQLLLDNARRTDSSLDEMISRAEPEEDLFVKNLENVQGDERDVIFISTTYGPPKAGERVAQRFGPINSDVGWRRLNVIATRARQRVEVFSSMYPTDVLVGDGTRRGPRALRDYLDYAQSGRVKDHGRRTGGAPDSEFEIAVGNVLEQLGYQWEPQVGVAGFFIDIGIVHPDRPGEFLIGIECDGAAYHSASSVRDRDRLRQEILESKGWSIHRIWSTNWIDTREAEIDRLRRTLEERLRVDREHRPTIPEPDDEYRVVEEVVEEIEAEQEIEESIEDALERFWHVNIKPLFPNRSNSILSKDMIRLLASRTPLSKPQWQRAVPMDWRVNVEPAEMAFLGDVLEVIEEYA